MTTTIQYPILGAVEYQEAYGGHAFEGQIMLGLERARFSLWEADLQAARQRLDQIAATLDQLAAQVAGAKAHAAADLLPLKNERWTEEDGSLVTTEQFIARMTLEHLSFRPLAEGTIDLTFADGGLFFEHAIQLSIGTDGKYTKAVIAG